MSPIVYSESARLNDEELTRTRCELRSKFECLIFAASQGLLALTIAEGEGYSTRKCVSGL